MREKTARDRACCRPGATESLGPSEGRKPGDGGLRAAAWPGQTSGGGMRLRELEQECQIHVFVFALVLFWKKTL